MSDAETIAFYDLQAEAYRKIAEQTASPHLAQMMERLPPGAHVLDLGCGPGQDSREFARAGFRVTAMDASLEMVRQAAMHTGVTTRHAPFDALDDVDTFDAVWASFSLLHAQRNDLPRHISAMSRALRTGGLLYVAMKIGTGEGRDRLGRFYTYMTASELRGLVEAAGFAVLGTEEGSARGFEGSVAPFVALTALRLADDAASDADPAA